MRNFGNIGFKDIAIALLVILLASFMNFAGAWLAGVIIFPLYLDSITLIAVTALYGLFPGLLCASLSYLIMSFLSNVYLAFILCQYCTIVFAWLTFRHFGKTRNSGKPKIEEFLWAGLWSALSNALLGNIIHNIIYPKEIYRPQVNIATQAVYQVWNNYNLAIHFSGIMENLVDKMISSLVSYALFCLVWKLTSKKK